MRAASTTPIFARLGLAGCLMLAACLTLAACAAPKVGFLRLRGTPPDAIVTVDDVYIGKLARLASTGVRVPEGEHRVTV
ncbi:MAG: hypothetical protein EXR75_14425, partial [Myxococcales bacterium]|nr:hypothetical protein [Myxococcales bacterium]